MGRISAHFNEREKEQLADGNMPLDPGDPLRYLHVCLGGACHGHITTHHRCHWGHRLLSPLLPLTCKGTNWNFQLLSHESTWAHLTGRQSESGILLQSFQRDGCGIQVAVKHPAFLSRDMLIIHCAADSNSVSSSFSPLLFHVHLAKLKSAFVLPWD